MIIKDKKRSTDRGGNLPVLDSVRIPDFCLVLYNSINVTAKEKESRKNEQFMKLVF
jgi:hypothetical protein